MSMVDPLTPEMRRRVDAAAAEVVAEVLGVQRPRPVRPLSDLQKAVFDRLELGESRSEIAAALGITYFAVRSRINNALASGHPIPTRRGAHDKA